LRATGATPEEIATEFPNFPIVDEPSEEQQQALDAEYETEQDVYQLGRHRQHEDNRRFYDENPLYGTHHEDKTPMTDAEYDAVRLTHLTEEIIPLFEDRFRYIKERLKSLDENSADYINTLKQGKTLKKQLKTLKEEEKELDFYLRRKPERKYKPRVYQDQTIKPNFSGDYLESDSDSEGSIVF
jgi:hypothetical protein